MAKDTKATEKAKGAEVKSAKPKSDSLEQRVADLEKTLGGISYTVRKHFG